MTREQLMKDFEEAFASKFVRGYLCSDKGYSPIAERLEYVDDRTKDIFQVWVSAFETYSSEPITG